MRELLLGGVVLLIFFSVFQFSKTTVFQNHKKTLSDEEILSERNLIKAKLLWARDGMIMYSGLKQWNPVKVTDGENPRWSPDGASIIFTRNNNVWIMNRDFGKQRLLFKGVVTENGAGAFWTRDGKKITAIKLKNLYQVLLYDLSTGKISVIHDEAKPPFRKYRLSQTAELRIGNRYLLAFTEDEGHRSFIIDLQEKKYIANDSMKAGDCGPRWAPNGKFLVTTRREWDRPVYRTDFFDTGKIGTLGKSRYLIGKGRSHWPSISNDSRYVLYSDHSNIQMWQVDRPVESKRHGVQLTKNDARDISPDLYIFQERD